MWLKVEESLGCSARDHTSLSGTCNLKRKKKKKSEGLATHPHLSETRIHAHTSRQKPACIHHPGPGILMKTFSTWHSQALNTPPAQPETWTVRGDIFKGMTHRSVTPSAFSVGGESAASCCSCHSARHYKCALYCCIESAALPGPAQAVPSEGAAPPFPQAGQAGQQAAGRRGLPLHAQRRVKCPVPFLDTLYSSVAVLGQILDIHVFSDTYTIS